MKGLIRKDFICVRRLYAKVVLPMIALYWILAVFSGREGAGASSFGSTLAILFSVFPLATFSVDKASHWDRYALSGPVDRRMMVLAKYLFSWGAIAVGALVTLIYILTVFLVRGGWRASEFLEEAGAALIFSAVGLLFNSLLLPCVYRFGVEKARLLLFLLVGVPLALSLLVRAFSIPSPSEAMLHLLKLFAPVLLALTAYLSYRLSLHIYKKQEID
ncbi:MAG: ABC-2 transporter permease [Provencibacterium sp.]|jgi:ABC-2 type transport system permease protein|nr:ABC-2 transporter permease [Provencibacterium sp.]